MIRINAYSDGFRKEYLAAVKKNVSIMDRKAVVASSKKFLPLDFFTAKDAEGRFEELILAPYKKLKEAIKKFLLRRNFFMEATIGEYAKTMIQEMIGVLQGGKKSKAARMEDIRKFLHQYYTEVKDGEEYEDVQRLIYQVGEPIYRDNLEKLVSIHKAEDKNWQIREMQKEIQQLEERIQRLKHD